MLTYGPISFRLHTLYHTKSFWLKSDNASQKDNYNRYGLRTYIFTVFFFELGITALKHILHIKQMKFRFYDSTNAELNYYF